MIESKYISETSLSYRKDYGQYFTPSLIAHIMVKWVMKDNPKTILDPAFGLGVFYDELLKNSGNRDVFFTGYEIDEHILNYTNHNATRSNLKVINQDYLEADIQIYDGIICNPPYMRFQKFLNRHNILPKIEEKIGKKLIGYSNISSVFLIKSLKELNLYGRLAYIMPFEFFNTGYGQEIKKSLLEENLLKQIVIFSNEKDIFPDVTTTVCILFCKKDYKHDAIKITQISTEVNISNLDDIENFYQKQIEPSGLPYNKKWTPIISSMFSSQRIPEDFCKVSLYGTFKRGLATGANEFFALTKAKIELLKLEGNVCECITKSPQIRKAVFTADDFNALYNSNKPVFCLDVKEHVDLSVRSYITLGEQQEFHKRYLTKNRNPWYKIEDRHPSPILFGVFSRGRLKVIRNYSNAVNFTCYHSFYPNMLGQMLVNKLFVYFLSDIGQSIIKMNKRSYGDNLDKLEPGDLNECLCPNTKQFELIEDWEATKVIEIAKTNIKLAIGMSNKLIDRIINIEFS